MTRAKFFRFTTTTREDTLILRGSVTVLHVYRIINKKLGHLDLIGNSGQSYKQFMLVNYDSRVVIWGIFKSGTTLES